MASGVEELLDMLFEMIDEAKNAPLSSDKCVIERDRALDLIDDIRSQFPMELGEARKVMAIRAETLAAAKREVAEAYDEIKKSRARFRALSGVGGAAPAAGAAGGRPMYDAAADED